VAADGAGLDAPKERSFLARDATGARGFACLWRAMATDWVPLRKEASGQGCDWGQKGLMEGASGQGCD
jgi:hypothetical protein